MCSIIDDVILVLTLVNFFNRKIKSQIFDYSGTHKAILSIKKTKRFVKFSLPSNPSIKFKASFYTCDIYNNHTKETVYPKC